MLMGHTLVSYNNYNGCCQGILGLTLSSFLDDIHRYLVETTILSC